MAYLLDVLDYYGLIVGGLERRARRFYQDAQHHLRELSQEQVRRLADALAAQGDDVDLGPELATAISELLPRDVFQLSEADLKRTGLHSWDVDKATHLVTLHLKEAAVKDFLEKH